MKLSREEELSFIEKTRRLMNNDEALKEACSIIDKHLSENDKFDVTRASWDAIGELPELPGATMVSGAIDIESAVLFYSGLVRCLQDACPHVLSGFGLVRHCILAARICSCEECLPSFLGKLKQHDISNERTSECDLCLRQNVQTFYKIRVAHSGSIYYGDVCEDCRNLITAGGGK